MDFGEDPPLQAASPALHCWTVRREGGREGKEGRRERGREGWR